MDRAKNLLCEALDADSIDLKEVKLIIYFMYFLLNFNPLFRSKVGIENLFKSLRCPFN